MLHIILTILKILGIFLLVILALALVIVGAVLFVPIRYRASGKKDSESFYVKAEFFWLLHLLRVRAVYPEPGQIKVKLLCFTLYDSLRESETDKKQQDEKKKDKKKNKEAKEKTKAKEKETSSLTEQSQATDSQEITTEHQITTEREINAEREINKEREMNAECEINAECGITTEHGINAEEATENEAEEKPGKIRQLFLKIKSVIQRIFDIIKNIRYTISRLCDKIKSIFADIQYYIEVFQEDETKRAFAFCKQQLCRIWKNIRPSKCKAELKIGTGEPDTTGYILAVHGMLYPLIGNTIAIEPDFENRILEGNFKLKGRITVFVLLRVAIKLYFDKDIRYFLKRFKREE